MDKMYGASYMLHGAASGVNDTHPGSQWGTQDVTHSGVTSCCRQKLPSTLRPVH